MKKTAIFLIIMILASICTAKYLGDYRTGDTINFGWSTCDQGGASASRSTKGTIRVYKNSDSNEITGGVTDTNDFDSVTGLHLCTVDLAADANYTKAADYSIVLTGAVIDGQTVNSVIATFSIQNRYKQPQIHDAEARRLNSKDVSVYFQLKDLQDGSAKTSLDCNSPGLAMYYVRKGEATTSVNAVHQTAAGDHADGGFCAVSDSNMPGLYRTDWPDYAFRGAGRFVVLTIDANDIKPAKKTILLSTTYNDIYGTDGAF